MEGVNVLTINVGSSSLKCSLIETADGHTHASSHTDWASEPTRYTFTSTESPAVLSEVGWSDVKPAIGRVAADLRVNTNEVIAAVAHRVVHGGTRFTQPVLVTAEVEDALHELTPLAPLHNPSCLEGIVAAREVFPNLPHVAVFDTAFHSTLAPEAYTYAIPQAWSDQWGLRRFGFHGLSHAYCSQRAAQILDRPSLGLRVVIAHLGHGASLAAIRDGKSIDTTMGFTPLEGLMMATRSGSVDPGLLCHLLRENHFSANQLDHALNRESGLIGVSGVSSDMRTVLQAAEAGNERAKLAIAIYVHRLRQGIGAMAATLGGLDALIFTGGVGQHSATIRAAACARLAFLGLELDPIANAAVTSDMDVSTTGTKGRILVIESNEELMLARECERVFN